MGGKHWNKNKNKNKNDPNETTPTGTTAPTTHNHTGAKQQNNNNNNNNQRKNNMNTDKNQNGKRGNDQPNANKNNNNNNNKFENKRIRTDFKDGNCVSCGMRHEFARDCPAKDHMCKNCGKPDHFEQKCKGTPRHAGQYCRYCNQNNHMTIDCKDVLKQIECANTMLYCDACNEAGHETLKCCNPAKFVPLYYFPRDQQRGRSYKFLPELPGTVLELSTNTPPDLRSLPQIQYARAGPGYIFSIANELAGRYTNQSSEIRPIVQQIAPAVQLRMIQKQNAPPFAVRYCISAWVSAMVLFGFEPFCNHCTRRMLVVDREGDYVDTCSHQLYTKDMFEYILEGCTCYSDGVTWQRKKDPVAESMGTTAEFVPGFTPDIGMGAVAATTMGTAGDAGMVM